MSWNFRIMKRKGEEEEEYYYTFVEAYYDKDGNVDGWTEEEVAPHWDSLEGLKDVVDQAFSYPVLDEEKILEAYNANTCLPDTEG